MRYIKDINNEAAADMPDNPVVSMYDNLEQYELLRERACFFTGHRMIKPSERLGVLANMKNTVSYLYSVGVTDFHTGGARGFDTLAAAHILDMKVDHPDMRLILDLPYKNQTVGWTDREKHSFEFILSQADEVRYAYDGEVTDRAEARKYLLMRNRIMADACRYCIAYFSGHKGGTSYTVKYAASKECEITNLYDIKNGGKE